MEYRDCFTVLIYDDEGDDIEVKCRKKKLTTILH